MKIITNGPEIAIEVGHEAEAVTRTQASEQGPVPLDPSARVVGEAGGQARAECRVSRPQVGGEPRAETPHRVVERQRGGNGADERVVDVLSGATM